MKRSGQHRLVQRIVQPRTLAILALMASSSIASAQKVTGYVVRSSTPHEQMESHTKQYWAQKVVIGGVVYEIEYKDGVHVVKVDGKKLPRSRVIEGGEVEGVENVVVLDENGKQVFEFYGAPRGGSWRSLGAVVRQGGMIEAFSDSEKAAQAAAYQAAYQTVYQSAYEPKVMLGIHLSVPSDILRTHLQLGDRKAILIEGVIEGLPAQKAGLEQYDVIVSIDGSDEASREILTKAMSKHEAGDVLKLVVRRAGNTLTIKPKLMSYDAEAIGAVAVNVEVGDDAQGGQWEVLVERLRDRGFPEAKTMNWRALENLDQQTRRNFFELRDDGQLFIRSQKQKLDAERTAIVAEWNALKGEHAQKLHEVGSDRLEALEARLMGLEDEMEAQMDRIENRMEKLTGLLERMFEKLSEDDE